MLSPWSRSLESLDLTLGQEFRVAHCEVCVTMHGNKARTFLLLVVLLLLAACAGTTAFAGAAPDPAEKHAKLEATFLEILRRIDHGEAPDSLKPLMTEQSVLWLEEMEVVAANETKAQLSERPFYEIIVVASYRMMEREGALAGIYKDKMLYLATGKKGLLNKALRLKLGSFEVKGDRGLRGLASSPKVPILFFVWEDRRWKLDLVATMPVITRGFETIGIKKEWSKTRTVIYLLEKAFRYSLRTPPDESLLDPVSQ